MPSPLTQAQVERIAELARLELSAEEIATFGPQLTAILDYAASIQQVDTTGVAPFTAIRDGVAWRGDEPVACTDRAEALAAAPDADGDQGLFRVPKVI